MSQELSSKDHSDIHEKQDKNEKKLDRLEDLMAQLINQNLALGKRMDEQGRRLDEQGRRFDEQGRRHDDLMEKLSALTQQINNIWSNLDERLTNLETKILNRLPPKSMTS